MAKLFYETLGVQNDATHEEIKRAYRLKAKALHPDVNKTRDTTREFQELQEVYSVLGSPERRKLYDEGNEVAAKSPETKATEADFDPFPCTSCEQISAQPRFISFYWVTSFIFFTYHRQCSGIYCPSCAAKRLFWSSLITGAIGWIGFPWGPAYFINALVYNIIGGKKDAEANALVLTKQALYFHNSGMPDVAAAIAAEALPYAQKSSKTSSGAACLNALGFFAGRKVVMNSKWKGISKPRLAALIGFVIPICAWYFFITMNQAEGPINEMDRSAATMNKAESLINEMDRSAATMNRQCPRMIDQITRMDRVISGPGLQFTYNYTVTTLTSSDVDVSKFREALHSSLVTNIRRETEMMKLAEKGVVFHYNWFGKDGVIISRLTLTKEDLVNPSVKLPTKASPSTNVIAAPSTVNVTQVAQQGHMSSVQTERNISALRSKAEQGDAFAQNMIGASYASGEGVLKDEVEAVKWYRKAAEQGYAMAQCDLADCYYDGKGIAKDDTEAAKWYRQSAEQGNASAQNNLGYLYANGQGVQYNAVSAYMWYLLAAAQGLEVAKETVSKIAPLLTPAQRSEGERKAREFKPRSVAPSNPLR